MYDTCKAYMQKACEYCRVRGALPTQPWHLVRWLEQVECVNSGIESLRYDVHGNTATGMWSFFYSTKGVESRRGAGADGSLFRLSIILTKPVTNPAGVSSASGTGFDYSQ